MKLRFLIPVFLIPLCISQVAAQDKPENPFAPSSCLGAQSEGKRWPSYCDQAQTLHAGLTQRSRTASIELGQLKKLLFEANDISMWQFLSLSLAERSPYYASRQRKIALMDEIEATINMEMKADRFVELAARVIRANAMSDGAAPGVIEDASLLLEGQKNPQLLELLSSTLIKHANALAALGDYQGAAQSLRICDKASDAWGNPLMPQRCYNLTTLTGREPVEFLREVAAREEALTCGRNLVPLCNLFWKTGHGKFLEGTNPAD